MSWAAHEFESYVLHKHLKVRVSYLAVLVGCLLPDLFTKLPVYGLNLGALHITHVNEPWKYHRGWPGVGPTHSLMFVLIVALATLAVTRHRGWCVGLLLGGWAHVLTDCFDSAGTMLFFPFSTQHYSVGMWSYASQEGRYGDASAYYSSLGGLWDVLWLCICLSNIKVFSKQHFLDHVAPYDPAWVWLQRKFALRTGTLVAIYRSYFVYGACRVIGWSMWARFINPRRGVDAVDLRWGGPFWVDKAPAFQRASTWWGFALHTIVGVTGLASSCVLLWFLIGRRLWARSHEPQVVPLLPDPVVMPAVTSVATTGQ